MHLPSLSEHVLLTFWTQLLVLLAVARGLGTLLRRVGQPAVVGQLLAGVVLGPSILGKLWPAAERLIAPTSATAAAPINAVAWVGVALLLVLAGFHTDLTLVRRLGRPASAVALGGLLLPFAAGIGLALTLPRYMRGAHASGTAFVLFIALALSISSLPVIAKILDELGFMRRNFGQVTVAVGMVNDLVGWLGLGVVAAIGGTSQLRFGAVAFPVLAIVVVLVLAVLLGQRTVDVILRRVRRVGGNETDAVSAVVLVAFALAVLLQAVRSDAVLGTYIAGILVGRSRFFQRGTRQHLESMTTGVFAPIFFATAGLRIDLAGLGRGSTAVWAAVLLGAAVSSKVAGAFAGARLARLPAREGMAMAVGLNCRGAVEIVIATVGLSLGVLSGTAYTVVVLMAIVTSVIAPPLLRLIVRDWEGSPEERARLEREESMARNLLVRPGRLLVVVEPGHAAVAAARLVHAVWPTDVAATAMVVGDGGDAAEVAAAMPGREVDVHAIATDASKRTTPGDAAAALLEETRLGYSVVALGASAVSAENGDDEALVSSLADAILTGTPLPVVIVRLGRERDRVPLRFRRVLLPVSGGPASRTAEELAYHLARTTATGVIVTHVEHGQVDHGTPAMAGAPSSAPRPPAGAASGVVRQAVAHAQEHDVPTRTSVRKGVSPAQEIVEEARTAGADLVVLGTTIRSLDGRPFLGHTVEHVLRTSEQAVVVVATPETVFAGGLVERFDSPA